ncbi:GGDEF domain-containing protein [Clostridium estertheticum]|nr:GGDEF domain-containing protein [Clostridium estertheticum]
MMNEINKLEMNTDYMYDELKTKNLQLQELASKDYLTNMYNHRTFFFYYEQLIRNSAISQHPFSIVMFDIDNFKRINDNYGHITGDMILRELSSLILANIREDDIAARYGGEEFAIIFPNTTPENGELICENIRNAIEKNIFKMEDQIINVTVSGGIAGVAFSNPNCKNNKFLEFVDQLLYKAKAQGKNQIHSDHQIIVIEN